MALIKEQIHLMCRFRISDPGPDRQALDAVLWLKSSLVWMRSSLVVRVSGCQCQNRNGPGFDPSILRHSRMAADEAVLNNVHKKKKFPFLDAVLYETNWCESDRIRICNTAFWRPKTTLWNSNQCCGSALVSALILKNILGQCGSDSGSESSSGSGFLFCMTKIVQFYSWKKNF